MSVDVMSLVWRKSAHKGIYLLLMLALADHAGEPDGTSIFPSIKTLALKTRSSERTVQRMLRKLEKSGEVVTIVKGHAIGGGNYTNEYAVNMDQIEAETKEYVVRRKKKGGDKTDTRGGDNIDTTVVTELCHQSGDKAVSPNPSENHHKKQSGGSAAFSDPPFKPMTHDEMKRQGLI